MIFSFFLFFIFLQLYFSPLSFGQCVQIELQKSVRKSIKIKNNSFYG